MSWGSYLFSYSGRINRARYWAFVLVSLVFLVAGLVVALPYILLEHRSTSDVGHPLSMLGMITIAAEGMVVLATIVSSLSIYVKRLHDRNKSGWWMILFGFLPGFINTIADQQLPSHINMPATVSAVLILTSLSISIWAFIELGCLRGTRGNNRFGADPLGGQ